MARFSLPALELNQAGITVTSVAKALGVSTQAVSQQLAGHRRPSRSLIPVVRALAGNDVAERVATAIEQQRVRVAE